jgi:pimeloyl-ACP methyl ester carboxylesterase
MIITRATHGAIAIAYQTDGPADGEPLLLIMGAGGQMLHWHPGFCAALIDRGFCVARFDNRDAGLSTHLNDRTLPNPLMLQLRPTAAPYDLHDMASDAIAVLDALGWPSAHVAGISQGGMIAQMVAIDHPTRVRSLISISSTPWKDWRGTDLRGVLRLSAVARRPVRSVDDFISQVLAIQEIAGSPGYPADTEWLRELSRQCYARNGYDAAAVRRQSAAIPAGGDRRPGLARLRIPALVIHGDSNRVFRPAAGRATADAIPGARLITYPGMGHDLPCELWPSIIDHIVDLTRQATEHRPHSPTAD